MLFENFDYPNFKVDTVQGRYVVHAQVLEFMGRLSRFMDTSNIGLSVEGRSLPCITLGKGETRILMWSQMHGNESTTTKAIFDLVNFLIHGNDQAREMLRNCTFKIIPMLNPDGAQAYTRVNANGVDLNRDAQDLGQPESKALRDTYTSFAPHYCFNLHDQRTIFNVGRTEKPATISFLSPSCDGERSINETRRKSMRLIALMHAALAHHIPGQVGRYDDTFNANCVGDTFQMLGTPTILFEAGHFPGDYQRERTRRYIFMALYSGIWGIALNHLDTVDYMDYFRIPENGKFFQDILIHNIGLVNRNFGKEDSLGLLYEEKLVDNSICFMTKIRFQISFFIHFR
ncbi:MAG: M14 metallopeptidase family protein, partial [Bacteroidota bacterium]